MELALQLQESVDLTQCDKEPIHIPGGIQPLGMLLVLHVPDLTILQVSNNTEHFIGLKTDYLLNQHVNTVLDDNQVQQLVEALRTKPVEDNPVFLFSLTSETGLEFSVSVHQHNELAVLELEQCPPPYADTHSDVESFSFFNQVRVSIQRIKSVTTQNDFFNETARQIKQLTGYDRVMMYQFDKQGHGCVVAEARENHLEPFLGLNYPASDIPQQARQLYLRNQIRCIADVSYIPVPVVPQLNPITLKPLDMSFCALRSVSPVHIRYLQNMGVRATLTISIVVDDQLWGLLTVRENKQVDQYRLKLQGMQTRFVEHMASEDNIIDGLIKFQPDLSDFINSDGAVIYLNGRYENMGNTPSQADIVQLINWLQQTVKEEMFASNCLSEVYPPAIAFKDVSCGILAINLYANNSDYIIWFRGEALQQVNWAGNPDKPVTVDNDKQVLTPRASFALWQQTVLMNSLPWRVYECQAAMEVRQAVRRMMLKKSDDLTRMNHTLEQKVIDRTSQLSATLTELESFSYSVSHDLRSPLRAINGYSHILIKEAAERLTDKEMLYLNNIVRSTQRMGSLIDDLIRLSRINRDEMTHQPVNLSDMATAIIIHLRNQEPDRQVKFTVQPDLMVWGDYGLLKVMMENLLNNAWKFTRNNLNAEIKFTFIAHDSCGGYYCIQDNGIGFDNQYANKLFLPFQRLHGKDEFPGTGIGLATVKRVLDRHGGKLWAVGEPDKGAHFCFELKTPCCCSADDHKAGKHITAVNN